MSNQPITLLPHFEEGVFSRVLRDSTPRYVGPLVGWSPFYFLGVFELFEHTVPAQMPWCPSPALLLPTRTRLG